MEKGNTFQHKMDLNMMENGNLEKRMAMGSRFFKMEQNMMVILKIVKKKEKVKLHILMEIITKVNG